MAQAKKISELTTAGVLDGSELAVVVQSGETRQTTVGAFNVALVSAVASLSDVVSVLSGTFTSVNAEVSLKAFRAGDHLTQVEYIEFDTSTSYAPAVGRVTWDIDYGTLQIGLVGGNVNLQVGQELVQRCYNSSSVTIGDGAVVRVIGATGQRLTVELAQADSDSSSMTVLGVATEDIGPHGQGFVTTEGIVHNFNTQGFSDGAVLYLSPTTAGAVTVTKPVAPQHSVMVGYVVKGGSVGGGSIYVKTQNGYELGELHDVKVSATASLADGEILVYNVSASVWTNSTILTEALASISALNSVVALLAPAAIVSLQADVSVLTVRVALVSASVSALNVQVAAVSASVSAFQVQLDAVSAALTSTNNIVSALNVQVVSLSAVVSTHELRIAQVSASVSVLTVQLDAVSSSVSALTVQVVSLSAVVSANELRITNVSASVSVLNVQLAAVSSSVSALQIQLNNVSTALTSTNNVVSALTVQVVSLSAVVSTHELRITNVSASVSVLNVQLAAVSSSVSALNVQVNAVSVLAAGKAKAADYQIFNSSGTWTKPSGFGANAYAFIQAWGGGGSGGKNSTAGQYGTGGGGGGYNERWVPLSSLGATETVTVGAGGTAITASNTVGNVGGNTTFGSWVTAYGGGRGDTAGLGGGGGGWLSAGGIGTPGKPLYLVDSASTYFQGHGTNSAAYSVDGDFHGGGGSAAAGNNSVWGGGGGGGVVASSGATGNGGTSSFGGNGGAAGNTTSGTAGTQPGGGGGGTKTGTSSGKGGDGRVIVTVFDGA